MDLFDFFDMFSEIGEFFKAAGEDIGNLFNAKKKRPFIHKPDDKPTQWGTESYEPWDFMPPEYWQERMKEKLEEKELLDKKIIEDYEARHQQSNDEPEENTESIEEFSSGEQETDSGAFESDGSFESGFDSDSNDSGSSGSYDGYFG